MSKPIDFVVLWVDNNDPTWQVDRAKYLTSSETEYTSGEARYRDWDTLKYWFRGIEKYTPWVNKVHFVTYGHLPSWLDTTHPKLNIVTHDHYIDKKYLPTFSANPIEINIHRIPNLSEQFVFFNDDMFMINKMNKEDFFVNGLPCDEAVFGHPLAYNYADDFYHYIMNCIALINEKFIFSNQVNRHYKKFMNEIYMDQLITNEFYTKLKCFSGFYTIHLPQCFLKSTFHEVWETYSDILEKTSMNKFRGVKDVTSYLMRYWQLMSGNFHPTYWRKKGWAFSVSQDVNRITDFIRNQERPMICVNDSVDVLDFELTKSSIIDAFQFILPEKSNFEI
ncbi:Stealth CR1 domain-containing protein [Paenibacillus septentrionalis]|uniref:Stealth CR1 domain-containing protein n=1 Tax=Paenibacillus septentrionalis TaxID=429342 RepID=A0ABW1V8D6_9BACL